MRRFAEVDVFSSGALTGNPLAVVVEADGLTDTQMQSFAAWTNLSETTFLLPPTQDLADYRVRIFTPTRELPFAGHPTLGSAHAWLEAGGVPRSDGTTLVQECGVGLVTLRRDAGTQTLAFAAPEWSRRGPLSEDVLARAARALRLPVAAIVAHSWGVNGPNWAIVELESAAAVRAVRPDVSVLERLDLGVVGMFDAEDARDAAEPTGHPRYAYEVRAFVAPPAPSEDPVTGSLNATVAQWMRSRGAVPARYVATQGSQVGRAGEIFVDDDGADIWIGGRTVTVISGSVQI